MLLFIPLKQTIRDTVEFCLDLEHSIEILI